MAGTITRRVFVEDERRNGSFLRMTWHPERRAFVVSNWDGSVCVGATRVPVEERVEPHRRPRRRPDRGRRADLATPPPAPHARPAPPHLVARPHRRRRRQPAPRQAPQHHEPPRRLIHRPLLRTRDACRQMCMQIVASSELGARDRQLLRFPRVR